MCKISPSYSLNACADLAQKLGNAVYSLITQFSDYSVALSSELAAELYKAVPRAYALAVFLAV